MSSPPGSAAATPPAEAPRSQLFVAVLALSGITAALQQTIIVPLVPQLPRLLNASAADTTWVVTATLLAGAVATPVVGRLADMFGKRRLLLCCLGLLIAGSLVSALSTGIVLLVVGRTLQGFATGIIPVGISLMRDLLPRERLGSATALMSASLGVGGALGLPLSALVAQNADWHVLFWAAASLGVLATVLVLTFVPESPQRTGGSFDLLGAAGLSVALVSLLLAVSKGASWGWASPITVSLFGVAAVALLGWGWWELRARQPLVDLRVSAGRQVLLTNSASAVFGFSMFAMSLVFPQLLQLPADTGYGLGQTIVVAGLVLAPGGLCMMAMSPVSARITAASGPRTTLMAGAVVVAAGYGTGVLLHSEVWHLVLCSVIISSGIGLAYGAMPSLVMAAVPVEQTAAANSLNNLMRAIGTAIASSVAGVLLANMTTSIGGRTVPAENAFVLVMGIGAVAALVALGITAFIPAREPVPERRADAEMPASADEPVQEPSDDQHTEVVVRHHDDPVAGAMVTVMGGGDRELGRGTTDEQGRCEFVHQKADRPRMVVAWWRDKSYAEFVAPLGPISHVLDLAAHDADEVTTSSRPSPAGR